MDETGIRRKWRGFVETLLFIAKHRKKYWIIPVILVLLFFGLLLFLDRAAPTVTPFTYTWF